MHPSSSSPILSFTLLPLFSLFLLLPVHLSQSYFFCLIRVTISGLVDLFFCLFLSFQITTAINNAATHHPDVSSLFIAHEQPLSLSVVHAWINDIIAHKQLLRMKGLIRVADTDVVYLLQVESLFSPSLSHSLPSSLLHSIFHLPIQSLTNFFLDIFFLIISSVSHCTGSRSNL